MELVTITSPLESGTWPGPVKPIFGQFPENLLFGQAKISMNFVNFHFWGVKTNYFLTKQLLDIA